MFTVMLIVVMARLNMRVKIFSKLLNNVRDYVRFVFKQTLIAIRLQNCYNLGTMITKMD